MSWFRTPKRIVPKSRLGKSAAAVVLAVSLVGGFEGVRTVAYKDIVGVPTVCFGETRGVKMGDRHTMAECEAMLGEGLEDFARKIDACLDHEDALPDKTYVAFLSLSYNIGTGAFCRSTVLRRANDNNLSGACDAILMWRKAGGKVVRGLVKRREAERELCLEGLADAAR